MSNRVQYDPLLAHYLAGELDARLRGRGCSAAPFFAPDLSATLTFEGGISLRADLHPRRGWLRLIDSPPEDAGEEFDGVCAGVHAPLDERVILVEIDVVGRFREQKRTVAIELLTNQWNCVVLDSGDSSIVNVLRGRRAGDRALFPGSKYRPPTTAHSRFGKGEISRWDAIGRWKELEELPASERVRALIGGFAFASSLNAAWVLSADTLGDAMERWLWLRSLPPAEPQLLELPAGPQPYPVPLAGIRSEAVASLLEAMDRVVAAPDAPSVERASLAPAEALVSGRIEALSRRIEALRREMASIGEADRIRSLADLLLSNLSRVPRGQSSVTLENWDGEPTPVPLDPALSPAENADRLYERARRKKRAEGQIPVMISRVERDLAELRDAADSIARGETPAWVSERLAEDTERARLRPEVEITLPYRVFRTSGGLEVRVGRSSADNDRLTFRESAPNDVWLHARSVPGSHTILRWGDPEGSPPARDLEEAAQLAAYFSRARSSGVVPVDWTRRKHVRKPRGAAPGAVVPQQVKTLFVEPDEKEVERLRWPRTEEQTG